MARVNLHVSFERVLHIDTTSNIDINADFFAQYFLGVYVWVFFIKLTGN